MSQKQNNTTNTTPDGKETKFDFSKSFHLVETTIQNLANSKEKHNELSKNQDYKEESLKQLLTILKEKGSSNVRGDSLPKEVRSFLSGRKIHSWDDPQNVNPGKKEKMIQDSEYRDYEKENAVKAATLMIQYFKRLSELQIDEVVKLITKQATPEAKISDAFLEIVLKLKLDFIELNMNKLAVERCLSLVELVKKETEALNTELDSRYQSTVFRLFGNNPEDIGILELEKIGNTCRAVNITKLSKPIDDAKEEVKEEVK